MAVCALTAAPLSLENMADFLKVSAPRSPGSSHAFHEVMMRRRGHASKFLIPTSCAEVVSHVHWRNRAGGGLKSTSDAFVVAFSNQLYDQHSF